MFLRIGVFIVGFIGNNPEESFQHLHSERLSLEEEEEEVVNEEPVGDGLKLVAVVVLFGNEGFECTGSQCLPEEWTN